MTSPNMTLAQFRQWTSSPAYQEYVADHDGRQVREVINRTERYLRGDATASERQKVEAFISRMKANSAGERKYGNPPISAKTASLRNWGYDPTGRY